MFLPFVASAVCVRLDCGVEGVAVEGVRGLLLKDSFGILERRAAPVGSPSWPCFSARITGCPLALFNDPLALFNVQVSLGWPVNPWTNTILQDVSIRFYKMRSTTGCRAQQHVLWTTIGGHILNRGMRSFVQHREALLVDFDLVRHGHSPWEATKATWRRNSAPACHTNACLKWYEVS